MDKSKEVKFDSRKLSEENFLNWLHDISTDPWTTLEMMREEVDKRLNYIKLVNQTSEHVSHAKIIDIKTGLKEIIGFCMEDERAICKVDEIIQFLSGYIDLFKVKTNH
jgi:hypothetical protein